MNASIIAAMKKAGYDYQNMSLEQLRAHNVRNPELVYDSIQAEKRGMSYGQYSALKAAGMLKNA